MPFFPLWLEYKGLDAAAIGIVLAAPMVVRIVSVPLATRFADRANALRTAIMVGAVGSLIGHALVGFSSGFLPILASIALAAVFFTPGYPLTDAYALRGLTDRRLAYGPIRLWASAAYIGGGFLLGSIPRADIIWLLVSAFAVGVVGAAFLLALAPHPHHKAGPHPSAKVL